MSPLGLKVGASLLTLLSFAGSTTFVARHVKNPDAPLHPPVVKVAPSTTTTTTQPNTRLHLEPSVRVTDQLAPLTFTYVS